MDGNLQNDLSEVVANDKAHVWHHLIQHKMFETTDPNIIVEEIGRAHVRTPVTRGSRMPSSA